MKLLLLLPRQFLRIEWWVQVQVQQLVRGGQFRLAHRGWFGCCCWNDNDSERGGGGIDPARSGAPNGGVFAIAFAVSARPLESSS